MFITIQAFHKGLRFLIAGLPRGRFPSRRLIDREGEWHRGHQRRDRALMTRIKMRRRLISISLRTRNSLSDFVGGLVYVVTKCRQRQRRRINCRVYSVCPLLEPSTARHSRSRSQSEPNDYFPKVPDQRSPARNPRRGGSPRHRQHNCTVGFIYFLL